MIPAWSPRGIFHIQGGYQLAGELIDKGVTAIFACNDLMACGVLKQATERNMKVPGDLSIVGFDDMDDFPKSWLYLLPRVSQPVFEIGKTSVVKLIEMIDRGVLSRKTSYSNQA